MPAAHDGRARGRLPFALTIPSQAADVLTTASALEPYHTRAEEWLSARGIVVALTHEPCMTGPATMTNYNTPIQTVTGVPPGDAQVDNNTDMIQDDPGDTPV